MVEFECPIYVYFYRLIAGFRALSTSIAVLIWWYFAVIHLPYNQCARQ